MLILSRSYQVMFAHREKPCPVAPSSVRAQLSELQEPSCFTLYFNFSFCCPGSPQGISQLSCRDRQISPTYTLTRASLTSALILLVSVGHLYQKIHHVLILHSTLLCSGRLWGRRAWGTIPKAALQQGLQLWERLPSALSMCGSSDPPHWCHVSSLTCHHPAWEPCHISPHIAPA